MENKKQNKMLQPTSAKTHAPILWGLFWLLVLLLVDQVTKIVADVYFIDIAGNGVGSGQPIAIIPGMLELCISYNRGIAFSSFSDASETLKIGIVVGTGVMMLVLAAIYCKVDVRRVWLRCALILVIAGGIGNFIDRMYYQVWDPASASPIGIRDGVRDMVYLNIIFNFGVCNFADFFICIGAVVLMLALVFFDQDAIWPLGKYKALSKEAEARAEAKKAKNTGGVAASSDQQVEKQEESHG